MFIYFSPPAGGFIQAVRWWVVMLNEAEWASAGASPGLQKNAVKYTSSKKTSCRETAAPKIDSTAVFK